MSGRDWLYLYDFDYWHLPKYILSGKETHVISFSQLKKRATRYYFEVLCEQNRISGPLMKYWEFDCRIVYSS